MAITTIKQNISHNFTRLSILTGGKFSLTSSHRTSNAETHSAAIPCRFAANDRDHDSMILSCKEHAGTTAESGLSERGSSASNSWVCARRSKRCKFIKKCRQLESTGCFFSYFNGSHTYTRAIRLQMTAKKLMSQYDAFTHKNAKEHDFLGVHEDYSIAGQSSLSMDGYIENIITRYSVTKTEFSHTRLHHIVLTSGQLITQRSKSILLCAVRNGREDMRTS